MEIRKVNKIDIPEISNLCELCFGNTMSELHYCWLYSYDDNFYSYVMLENNRIIAHQAFIKRKYSYLNKELTIGLSAGTMILPEYQKSGDFYYLLKESIADFSGDIIIGFPNENSHGILCKLFHYSCVPENLYRLDLRSKMNYIDKPLADPFIRNDLKWRIDNHPFNHYHKKTKGNCFIIWKEYLTDSIDIVYVNVINNDFVDMIGEFSGKYSFVNIISIYSEQMEQIGFKKIPGNEFVYKAYNIEYDNLVFPCQMIDSDIY